MSAGTSSGAIQLQTSKDPWILHPDGSPGVPGQRRHVVPKKTNEKKSVSKEAAAVTAEESRRETEKQAKKQGKQQPWVKPPPHYTDGIPSSQLSREEVRERQVRLEAMCGGKKGFAEAFAQMCADEPHKLAELLQQPGVAAAMEARRVERAKQQDARMAQLYSLIPGEHEFDGEADGGHQKQQDKIAAFIAQLRAEDGTECEEGLSDEWESEEGEEGGGDGARD